LIELRLERTTNAMAAGLVSVALALFLVACGEDSSSPDITLDKFTACLKNSNTFYEDECEGSTVIFKAFAKSYSGTSGTRLRLVKECTDTFSYKEDSPLEVDGNNLDKSFFEENLGSCVELFAKVVEKDGSKPDVSVIEVLRIESESEKEARILARKKEVKDAQVAGFDSIEEYRAYKASDFELGSSYRKAKAIGINTWADWLAHLDAEKEKLEAPRSPKWVSIEQIPPEWTSLTIKPRDGRQECDASIPRSSDENLSFTIRDAIKRVYMVGNYWKFPARAGYPQQPPKKFLSYTKILKVWRNEKVPSHYLLWDSKNEFSQILIKDGRAFGQHALLDGKRLDPLQALGMKFVEQDFDRFGLDTGETKPWGDEDNVQCDFETLDVLLDEEFEFVLLEGSSPNVRRTKSLSTLRAFFTNKR
jgi:hypothetical protein